LEIRGGGQRQAGRNVVRLVREAALRPPYDPGERERLVVPRALVREEQTEVRAGHPDLALVRAGGLVGEARRGRPVARLRERPFGYLRDLRLAGTVDAQPEVDRDLRLVDREALFDRAADRRQVAVGDRKGSPPGEHPRSPVHVDAAVHDRLLVELELREAVRERSRRAEQLRAALLVIAILLLQVLRPEQEPLAPDHALPSCHASACSPPVDGPLSDARVRAGAAPAATTSTRPPRSPRRTSLPASP